jgi:hypothetical protein
VPPLLAVVEATARDAVRDAPLAERPDPGALRLVLESRGGEGDARYDVPLSFAQIERRYGRRYVVTEWFTPAATRTEALAS